MVDVSAELSQLDTTLLDLVTLIAYCYTTTNMMTLWGSTDFSSFISVLCDSKREKIKQHMSLKSI